VQYKVKPRVDESMLETHEASLLVEKNRTEAEVVGKFYQVPEESWYCRLFVMA
jgi:hypothetical protein